MKKVLVISVLLELPLAIFGQECFAQSVSTFGQSWTTLYGFATPSDRSVSLQEAQAIYNIENGLGKPVYNTYNDNRSGYIETNSGGGAITGSSQIGNQIGEQTYSVGALNTGSTTITLHGDGNTVTANNSADTHGCVNGSIVHSSSTNGSSTDSAIVLPDDLLTALSTLNIDHPGQLSADCQVQ